MVAILADVPVAAALTLGSLRRQGYAVTAILILLAEEQLEDALGRLLTEGIRDLRHLKNEEELATLCQQQMNRATPYNLVVALE